MNIYESIIYIYLYILRLMARRIAKNTEKWPFWHFFVHCSRRKPFLGRKSCSDGRSSFFIIVAERMSFLTKKSDYSHLLYF